MRALSLSPADVVESCEWIIGEPNVGDICDGVNVIEKAVETAAKQIADLPLDTFSLASWKTTGLGCSLFCC